MLSRIVAVFIASVFLSLVAPLQFTRAAVASPKYRVSLPLVVSAQAAAPQAAEQTVEAQTLAQINQQRVTNGCAPLQLNAELSLAAVRHSRDMAVQSYFSHIAKDGSTFTDRAQAAEYRFHPSGEIIAAGQSTAVATVSDWMNSPGHRAIILTCANDDIGIAMYADPSSQWRFYWTAVFGQH